MPIPLGAVRMVSYILENKYLLRIACPNACVKIQYTAR